jgi:hypothetical protein
MRRRHAAAGLALSALMLSGCASNDAPVTVYKPPIEMGQLAPDLTAPDNSFALLSDAQTEGRFSCPLAIAMLQPGSDVDGGQLQLVAPQPREQSNWTETMRGMRMLRCLMFLTPHSIAPEPQSLPVLCAAARRVGAPLLVVYARNGLGPNEAEVLGVLYDTGSQQAIATVHASAHFPIYDDGVEISPQNEEGDLREIDARYQAQRRFERHVREVVRQLAHRDTPPATTQPSKWDRPFIERWWIHRD